MERALGQQTQSCHWLAEEPRASQTTNLDLSFLICSMKESDKRSSQAASRFSGPKDLLGGDHVLTPIWIHEPLLWPRAPPLLFSSFILVFFTLIGLFSFAGV